MDIYTASAEYHIDTDLVAGLTFLVFLTFCITLMFIHQRNSK